MRTIRLWCDDLSKTKESDKVEVSKPESHHFSHVLRGKVGEKIELLDGRGYRASVICCEITGRKPIFECVSKLFTEVTHKLHVFSPLPKGKRLPYMMEKLQEVGVSSWTPLVTEYSVRDKLSSNQKEKLLERLKDACKQSGVAWRMEVHSDMCLEDALKLKSLYALDIGGEKWGEVNKLAEDTHLLLGPEAGWSDGERSSIIENEIKRIGLSLNHLRMETAAIIGSARIMESCSPF